MKISNLISLTFIIIAIILFWSLKEIVIQIFASIILAMALCSLTGKIEKLLSIPRFLALTITITSLILLLIIFILIVVPQFTNEFQQLITDLPSAAREIWELLQSLVREFSTIIYGSNIDPKLEKGILEKVIFSMPDSATLANGVTDSLSKIVGLASNLGVGIIQLLFILSVSLMITVQPNSYREVFILLIPSFYRRRARSILIMCGSALTNWMFGVLISSSFVALLAAIGLYILGIKLVFANAIIAGLLNVIPNVGPTISTIFPMSIAFLDSPWKSVAVLGMYIIIQNIESYLITPSIMQKQVKLLPGLALTSQFIFAIIFGPIGLILALPLSVVLQVLIKEILIEDILESKSSYKLT
ncbi:AI-2E family transporter [Prochlorococcus sp. MIT 1223]|uniref:AI-2E family transporter n=1 Tax=Prochlorococcus sp. MIT 1223 TaxID=3096217 RepID=UPI002A7498AA|nr:AI-2E family transporter [Prochlorococcus sp. MIT 1223]